MVNDCTRAGVKLFVNYMRRADKGVIEIKKLFENESFSTPIKGNVWYSKGYFNNGSHYFNLLEFWFGNLISSNLIAIYKNNKLDYEADLFLEFKKGKVVFQSISNSNYSHSQIELFSDSGMLKYDRGGNIISWQTLEKHPYIDNLNILNSKSAYIETNINYYQWDVVEQISRYMQSESHTLYSEKKRYKHFKICTKQLI